MKKNVLKSVLGLGLLSLFVASCSKDEPAPNPTPEPPAKVYGVSKATGVSGGKTTITDYVYNSNKLIESTITNEKGDKIEYKYNGTKLTSTVSTKKTTSSSGVESTTTTTTTYTYDGDNISQSDAEEVVTGGFYTYKTKKTYTYESGNLTKTTTYGTDRNGKEYVKGEDKVKNRDTNGNIISIETYGLKNQLEGDPILVLQSTTNSTYDTVKTTMGEPFTAAYRRISDGSAFGNYAQLTTQIATTSDADSPLSLSLISKYTYTDGKITGATSTLKMKSGDNPETTNTFTGTYEYIEL